MASRLKKAIGEKIKQLRKKKGYSQEYLAERVGIDTKQISRIENGINYPYVRNLEKLCVALNVHPKELFDFEWQIEEENLQESNGTYGKFNGKSKYSIGVEQAVTINEDFESDFSWVEFAYADKTLILQAKQLNMVRSVRYDDNDRILFFAHYFPSGKIVIEYLDKEFEKSCLYQAALKNLNKYKNNTKFLRTINSLAKLEK